MDNGWISVEERLPELGEPVLLAAFGHVQQVAYERQHWPQGWDEELTAADFWVAAVDVEGEEVIPLYHASHWMQLPAPPATASPFLRRTS